MKVSLSLAFVELLDGAGFALLGEFLLAVAPKETKRSCPYIRPCAARRVRSLHRHSRGTPRRAILGPSRLSRHPCRSTPSTSIPLTLLKGAIGGACWFVQKEAKPKQHQQSFKRLGANSPSGGRVEVLRRGTRGRTPSEERRTGPPRQGRPFVTAPGATPEGGNPGKAGAGCRGGLLFGYFLLARQEKVTRPGGRNQMYQHTRQSV